MACAISSNENRMYVAREASYGEVPAVTAGERIPALKLAIHEERERLTRRDKTGSRTFAGYPPQGRKQVQFDLRTYMTQWNGATSEPAYGALLSASLGGAPRLFAGGTLAGMPVPARAQFTSPHQLTLGQAIAYGGEMRFVTAVVDATTVQLNAPFSVMAPANAAFGPTVTYSPSTALPSVSLFDYWSPTTAVQRVLSGGGVDEFSFAVNGDFHEFRFRGIGSEVIDSASFTDGQGGLSAFPSEPEIAGALPGLVAGNLGQAWLGSGPDRFLTLTEAELTVRNQLETRSREFGSNRARCLSPGVRQVSLDFQIYADDDGATAGLLQAARQESPVSVMLQLGTQSGQLAGCFLRSVVLQAPDFNDKENRLLWDFRDCRAQGSADDEVFFAFA